MAELENNNSSIADKKSQGKHKKKLVGLFLLLLGIIIGFGISFIYFSTFGNIKKKLSFPYISTLQRDPKTGLSCEAIVGSVMYGENNQIRKGITAELFKGTDKLAIKVNEEGKFNFITRAALEAGETETSDNWTIQQNNENSLIATLSKFNETIPIQNFVDVFYLNKDNGIGLWVKTRATNLGIETPEAQSYLLKCL